MNRFIRSLSCIFVTILFYHQSHAGSLTEPFVLDRSEVHKVESVNVRGQIYDLQVYLPQSYESTPEQSYPVVYVLDGQWGFTMMAQIADNLVYDGMIPEVIVVGITWGGEGDIAGELRQRDFFRQAYPWLPLSGGAENFLNALTGELVPHVESSYRVEGQKKFLTGGSLSGLFTTYAMLEKPGFFDGYLATAGSYVADMEYLDDKLASLAGTKALRGVRSYIAVGQWDSGIDSVKEFSDKLRASKLKGLRHKYHRIRRVGHSGAASISTTYGLQYLFKRPSLKLGLGFLEQYSGEFLGGPEGLEPFPLSVLVVDRKRIALTDGFQYNEFYAETQTKFYVKGINLTIEFSDEDNFTLDSQGTLMHFSRVSE